MTQPSKLDILNLKKAKFFKKEGGRIKPKLKDLAARLGVSPATVSLALHGRPGVSAQTRERVLAALEETGYGEALRRAPPKNVRLVLYKSSREEVDGPFFLELIEGTERQAKKNGLGLLVTTLDAAETEEREIAALRENGCEGIILLAAEASPKTLALFGRAGLPLVVLEQSSGDAAGSPAVRVPKRRLGAAAVLLLQALSEDPPEEPAVITVGTAAPRRSVSPALPPEETRETNKEEERWKRSDSASRRPGVSASARRTHIVLRTSPSKRFGRTRGSR